MPCKQLFSADAEIETDQCNQLGSDTFKQLQVMKFEWSRDAVHQAKLNSAAIEDPLEPFRDYLIWETNLQLSSNGASRVIPTPSGILVV